MALGTLIRTWAMPDGDIQGIAHDGKYVWLVGNSTNLIYQTSVGGTTIRTFATPSHFQGGNNWRGLAYIGHHLWLCDRDSSDLDAAIHQIRPTNGSLVRTIQINNSINHIAQLAGVSFVGLMNAVWVAEASERQRLNLITLRGDIEQGIRMSILLSIPTLINGVLAETRNLFTLSRPSGPIREMVRLYNTFVTGTTIRTGAIGGIGGGTPTAFHWDQRTLWITDPTNLVVRQVALS